MSCMVFTSPNYIETSLNANSDIQIPRPSNFLRSLTLPVPRPIYPHSWVQCETPTLQSPYTVVVSLTRDILICHPTTGARHHSRQHRPSRSIMWSPVGPRISRNPLKMRTCSAHVMDLRFQTQVLVQMREDELGAARRFTNMKHKLYIITNL